MKKIVTTLFCVFGVSTCVALGPSELTFNGIRFHKSDEKRQNNVIVADYEAYGPESTASITITHVLDKNDPGQIADGLKQKKSIEVMDIEKLKPDNSDVLVTFVKFDQANLKVENNLCRIFKNGQNGSIVFQYIDTKKIKSQAEGATIPDFTQLADNMKQLGIDQYFTAQAAIAQNGEDFGQYRRSNIRRTQSYSNGHIPWYKRPGARAGADAYRDNRSRYR